MKMWIQRSKEVLTRRLVVALIAVVAAGSVATLNFAKSATAAVAAPAAAALDDNSVAALLTLDRAMETLAARVTPAVVNVTVTSKPNPQKASDDSPDAEQFFGPFGGNPFGGRQFNFPGNPRSRVEHG